MRIQGLSTVPLETHCVVGDVLYVGGFENVTLIVIMCGVAAEAHMITNGLYAEGLCEFKSVGSLGGFRDAGVGYY